VYNALPGMPGMGIQETEVESRKLTSVPGGEIE
jgi:hypothetical protein